MLVIACGPWKGFRTWVAQGTIYRGWALAEQEQQKKD